MENVIIIGAGPAGYTAGIYASRADLAPLLLAGPQPGGQLTTTTEVENWPGEDKGVMGPELVLKLRAQAEKFGTRVVEETVASVDFSARPYKVMTDGGKTGYHGYWGVNFYQLDEHLPSPGLGFKELTAGLRAKRLKIACNGNATADRLAEILAPHRPGDKPITVVYRSDAGVTGAVELSSDWRVNLDDALVARLREWLARDNVEIVY